MLVVVSFIAIAAGRLFNVYGMALLINRCSGREVINQKYMVPRMGAICVVRHVAVRIARRHGLRLGPVLLPGPDPGKRRHRAHCDPDYLADHRIDFVYQTIDRGGGPRTESCA